MPEPRPLSGLRRRACLAVLVLPALVAACATPLERCIAGATPRDLVVLRGLIATSEGNLRRGYAIDRSEVTETRWVLCGARGNVLTDGVTAKPERPVMCREEFVREITRPRAIDLAAETRMLEGMKARAARIEAGIAPAVAACRATHPAG